MADYDPTPEVDDEDELVFEEEEQPAKSAELLRLEGLERHGNLTHKADIDLLEELRASGSDADPEASEEE